MKGDGRVLINMAALSMTYVNGGEAQNHIKASADEAARICKELNDSGALVGQDGEYIREQFEIVAQTMVKLSNSISNIKKDINQTINIAVEGTKGALVDQTTAAKAKKKVGVMAKD